MSEPLTSAEPKKDIDRLIQAGERVYDLALVLDGVGLTHPAFEAWRSAAAGAAHRCALRRGAKPEPGDLEAHAAAVVAMADRVRDLEADVQRGRGEVLSQSYDARLAKQGAEAQLARANCLVRRMSYINAVVSLANLAVIVGVVL